MVIVGNKPLEPSELTEFTENSFEKNILKQMSKSSQTYQYDNLDQLRFELKLRKEIVDAAYDLAGSGMDFEVFRETRANPRYWDRTNQGGFTLKRGAVPSEAIMDIYENGQKYGTECATAMMIVYYKALLTTFGAKRFNELFPTITLMNWHNIPPLLREVGYMDPAGEYIPGDRLYFENPDVDPKTPEWQGENVIFLAPDKFYGHGIGITNASTIIKGLNQNRRRNADDSAFLSKDSGRPDFKNLSKVYYNQ
ncbi:MAG: protein-glutamine gamma-glutamyltransferase [Clostridiales bacterium 43-6]|nr:MAG: protein-glutamine gamma-glutamyltransferase [Clostridiales bacterium 43-6]